MRVFTLLSEFTFYLSANGTWTMHEFRSNNGAYEWEQTWYDASAKDPFRRPGTSRVVWEDEK